ncbi:MAG TPA: DUF11 domain-containing protein, partial [Euryarchaeota archaeon]|nr:DUF11 domain-containing protein [Euryarchaeota archaeon]
LYFYASVEEGIFFGDVIPDDKQSRVLMQETRSSSTQQETKNTDASDLPPQDQYTPQNTKSSIQPPPSKRLTGEDVMYIFLDTTLSNTGYNVKGMLADRMLEITGKNGVVTSTVMKEFSGTASYEFQWTDTTLSADALSDGNTRVEILLDASTLGDLSQLNYIIHATDWKGRGDYSSMAPSNEASVYVPNQFTRGPLQPHPVVGFVVGATGTGMNGIDVSVEWVNAGITYARNTVSGVNGLGQPGWYQVDLFPSNYSSGDPLWANATLGGVPIGSNFTLIQSGDNILPDDDFEYMNITYDGPYIVVEKYTTDASVQPGDIFTYTIWFNNTGNGTATDVWLNDTLPYGVDYVSDTSLTVPGLTEISFLSWHISNVGPLENYSFTITVQVWANHTSEYLLTNTIGGNFTTPLGVTFPITEATETTPLYLANITVEKTVDMAVASPGDTLTYTIYFNNAGNGTAAYVYIEDVFPFDYLENVAYSTPPDGTIGPNTVFWEFFDMVPGDYTINITADINMTVLTGTIVENVVILNYTNAANYSLAPSQDNATTLISMANISVEKSPGHQIARPGDLVTFTIYYNNTGGYVASHVYINDTLPVGLSYDSDTAPEIPTVVGNNISWHLTDVSLGEHNFTLTVLVNSSLADGVILTNNIELEFYYPNG